jgi:hypothetical protein
MRVRLLGLCAAAALLGLCVPVAFAGPVLIAGNLGNGYQSGTANSWATGGSGSSYSENAVGFTVASGESFDLDYIQYVTNWFSGSGSLTIGLYSGVPGGVSTELTSWILPQAASPTQGAAVEWSSYPSGVLLTSGNYFIELSTTVGTVWGWQWNNEMPADTANWYSNFPNSGSPGWFSEAGNITPAFDVYGTPVSSTPEPAPFVLLLSGFVGILGVAARRWKLASDKA